MSNSRLKFADELEEASNRIADISRADLQIMLRRAALRLRNTVGLILDPGVDDAVIALSVATGTPKQEMLRRIIRELLETGGFLCCSRRAKCIEWPVSTSIRADRQPYASCHLLT